MPRANSLSMLREAVTPSNLLTLLSLNLALCAMWHMPSLNWAVWACIGCISLDVLDGRVARAIGKPGVLGAQLDSLADIVAFGALPALLVLHSSVGPTWAINAAGASVYMMCAALRLARFNVAAPASAPSMFFTGLPSPAAAGLVVSAIAVLNILSFNYPSMDRQWVVALGSASVAAIVGLLMVSNLPFLSFKGKAAEKPTAGSTRLPNIKRIAAAALVVTGLLVIPEATLFLVFALYAASGVLIRRKMKRFMGRLALARASALARAEKASLHSTVSADNPHG